LGSDAIWGIEATRAINVEMPIVIFAFLFGVSMDYQVFIISRMREAYDRTGSTETAVIEGIGRTGRLVTTAALILALAFVAFSATPGTEAKDLRTRAGRRNPDRRDHHPRPPRARRGRHPRPLELVAARLGGARAPRRAVARAAARSSWPGDDRGRAEVPARRSSGRLMRAVHGTVHAAHH
jgi:hypothetical protein